MKPYKSVEYYYYFSCPEIGKKIIQTIFQKKKFCLWKIWPINFRKMVETDEDLRMEVVYSLRTHR